MLAEKLEHLCSFGLLTDYQPVEVPGARYQGVPIYQSDRSKSRRTWARIYFVDCDAFLRRAGNLTAENCSDFQSELLGRTFFGENTPLRWNMYLYFVYGEARALDRIARTEIESDTHYARKYVVSTNALPASFALTNYSLRGKTMPEPEADWQNILASAGLTNCLYDNRYSHFVDHYLQSDLAAPQIGLSVCNTVQADDSLRIQKLDTLLMRHYREAIFGDETTLPLKQVNIIEGENGTGKSSLVDAIEYAMTGSTKRLVDNNGTPHSGFAEVTGINWAGQPLILPSEGGPDIKSREQAWYHIPKTAKRTTIGKKFEQINRFSIESVFSMVYSQCRDKDNHLIDSLTALCFDENLLLMEKNWTTYLERFESEQSKIERDLNNTLSAQTLYEHKRQTLVREIQERQVNLKNLYLALFDIEPQHEDYSRFEDFNLRFGQDIAILEQVEHAISLDRLRQHTAEHDKKLLEQRAAAEKLTRLEQQKVQAQRQHQALEEQASSLQRQGERYTELLRQVQDCQAQFAAADILEATLNETMSELTVTAASIKKIHQEYDGFLTANRNQALLSLSEMETQEKEAQLQITQLGKTLQERTERKKSLEASMISMRRNIDALEKKQMDLAHMGEVLVKTLQSSNCPLCGNSYSDVGELLSCIDDFAESNKVPMHEQMSLHQMELNDVEVNIKKLEEALHEARSRVAFLQNMRRVCQACSETFRFSLDLYTFLGDIAFQLDEREAVISRRKDELSHLQRAYGLLVSAFEAMGVAKTSLSVYEKYCLEAKSRSVDKFGEIYTQKGPLESQIAQISKDILELGNVSEVVSQDEQINRLLHALMDAVARMRDGGLLVVEDTDLLQLRGLLFQLDGAVAVTQQNKEIQDVVRHLATLNETVSTSKQKVDRCQTAVEVLRQLKNLSQYAYAFVEENLQEISMVFKKIHLPPEFSDLQIQEGEIVIMRPDSNRPVRINEMSLGQKTSLALAVMFQMHMMGKNTPRILLLDEPVSNLDDIHIMNLVDILRELTINGAQLFITTSNKEVASYLIRKFAFLDDDVAYYKLKRRISNGQVGATDIEKKEISERMSYS